MKPPARLQLATVIATKSFRLSFVVVMALLLATSARATTNRKPVKAGRCWRSGGVSRRRQHERQASAHAPDVRP
jgi:hypothetical protein